jgi:hypothetical protein
MGTCKIAACLAVGILWAASAAAQQPTAPNPEFHAGRQAARADLIQAEKLLAAGGKRGPDGEACRLMNAYFLYIVKEAAAAGAKTRIAAWPDLTWEEQNAVSQKIDEPLERNKRLRSHACTAKRQ